MPCECPECGADVLAPGTVCQDCQTPYTCGCCGDQFPAAEYAGFSDTEDDGIVCNECFELYSACDNCGCVFLIGDMETIGDLLMCSSCAEDHTTCWNCDGIISAEDALYLRSHAFCSDCSDELLSDCADCGDRYYNSEMQSNMYGDLVCDSCFHSNDSADVHSYNYKPDPLFHNDDSSFDDSPQDNTVYIGFELEVEVPNSVSECAAAVCEYSEEGDAFYLKEDGSITSGFEVVSHPHSIVALNDAGWLREVLNCLTGYDCKSHDTSTCGLHVHVSRRHLSYTETVKLGMLVHLNQSQWRKIARRNCTEWSRFKELPCKLVDMGGNPQSRYEALNWHNFETVEFRMYKGTLLYDSVLAAIQVSHAAVAFIRTVPTPVIAKPTAWSEFGRFVCAQPEYRAAAVRYFNGSDPAETREV